MQPNDRHSATPSPEPQTSAAGGENAAVARWTDEDEERLLLAALDIAREPLESFDATVSPVERIRRAVGGNFTAEEIVRKTKQLRKRYEEMCCTRLRNSLGEADARVFGVAFEISDKIWGRQK
ncbi:hypothetical protein AXF42_Ash019652 [Apostasia shenzhenica]|uniref:Glabrous enhancer-binding protein-like DBD domain-containing protein n=1 Tax=Apostasia shenzhenica TaxID=1088818 RepID=A0A2H9ZTP7_9ASPA|nr:hypothetical protein AXF42_Ash019652 [Apostasia shenzhenica]